MTDAVERLRSMLSTAGVSAEDMKAGVRLTERGMQKVAAALGISVDDVPSLLNTLTSKMRREPGLVPVTEERFSSEKDYLGNVTVRDAVTGREAFLQGSEAAELLARLKADADKQAVLAAYVHLMESAVAGAMPEEDEDADYDAEIGQNWGTYNFPWSLDGRHGTGTARYRGIGPDMKLSLIHVRDGRGTEINPDPTMKARLMDAARSFIGKE